MATLNLKNEGSAKKYKISFEKGKYIVLGVENLIEHKLGVRTGKIVK